MVDAREPSIAVLLEERAALLRRIDELERRLPAAEEAAFRESVLWHVTEGLCVCHAVEDFPFVRFTVWNRRMVEITGYDIDRINELGWYQTVYRDPEVSARAQARMAEMRYGRDLLGEEWEITRADGERRVISISTSLLQGAGGVSHVLALMQDITERRRGETALRESEARYRATVEHAPVGIVNAGVGGGVLGANAYLCAMLGYEREELIGRLAREFVHPEDIARMEAELIELVTTHLPAKVLEHRLVCKDGSIRWVEASVALLEDGAGQAYESVTVLKDVTSLKQAEEERRRLQAQIQHAQKLESLGVLAGGIAHDFNNLLCGILGSADLALYDLEPGHPARSDLELLHDAAQRATEVCRQMLAYSGKGRFVIEPIDVSLLVGQMRHLVEVSISKKAALRLDLAADVPAVEADATQLRQILLNLVVNASESLGDRSGTISIATGALDCDAAYLRDVYLNEALAEGRYTFLEVTDTGCGMDEGTRIKIFDPFFTTKFAGRGLGLAATLGIVRGHRGAIKVYSEPGRGTSVKVLLPALSRDVKVEPKATPGSDWRGTGLALVVDDEPTVRAVVQKMLERLGYSVIVAVDGEDALGIFAQRSDEIDVVILDMMMPKLSGEETFRELRRLRPNVTVLLTSGYNEQDATSRFAGKGLAGFLQKPIQLAALRDKLREIVQHR